MDEELTGLFDAYNAAPGNDAVMTAIIRTAREAASGSAAVSELASMRPGDLKKPATRRAVARFLLDHEQFEQAIAWLSDDDGETLIMRAQAFLAAGQQTSAVEAYRTALEIDPALATPDLDEKLRMTQAASRETATVFNLAGEKIENDEEGPTPHILWQDTQEKITFADVGGHSHVKSQIRRKIITPFQKPSMFRKFKKKAGGGVLMYGPPGCGKTMLARATAGECGAEFYAIQIPEILDMYIGESEKRLAAAFETARQHRPAVLFIDEIEAVAAKRRYDGTNQTMSTLVSTFLSEMDGLAQNNDGLLILAATNVPWSIDSAFRRPGRFDKVIFVPPPDEAARAEILRGALSERPQEPDLAIEAIASATSGFSGADLTGLIETATEIAIDDSIEADAVVKISNAHLKQALQELRPTTLEWLTSARNYAKYANEGGLYDDVLAFLKQHGKG